MNEISATERAPTAADTAPDDREEGVETIFKAHHATMVRLAVVLGADDAEDIVAEAFYQLYRRWRQLRNPDAAVGFLRSVVVNLTRMRIRHIQVARRHVRRAEPAIEPVQSGESLAVLRDDQRALVEAVRHLPARQREALVLRYWLDLSEREIAKTMDVSVGSVKVHISRGMAALTRKFEDHR
ncbi:sigma-70 family RNA polymerase sigma factor [Pseudonocardia sp. TRM90224]|uniref:sigma-70 family RNA polymerase sigma factor n=1 Tax=Pseudonocardia sp. TRM90224 TaxID=2812678 RepID=UPI001E49E239|nr:sigma-70 family RNA polymerase sigma factor [Pseudonocardia sp. TRM90224]